MATASPSLNPRCFLKGEGRETYRRREGSAVPDAAGDGAAESWPKVSAGGLGRGRLLRRAPASRSQMAGESQG